MLPGVISDSRFQMSNSLPDRDRIGFRVATLARAWRRAVDQDLAASGLTDASWTPLMHLGLIGDGILQTELAVRVGIDASTLVRLIDILVDRGLVERQVDARDRRERRILLTVAGRQRFEEIRARLAHIESSFLADLSPADVDRLDHSLGRIAARIEAAAGQPA